MRGDPCFRGDDRKCKDDIVFCGDDGECGDYGDKNSHLELKSLSNQKLLFQTQFLAQKERNISLQVIQHLQEIEKRKLYLERGFSSLFDYAVKDLGYSHSAAYRRIKAMRLCHDIPQATSKIKNGHLNLTTASQLQIFFEKQKKKDKKQTLDKTNKFKQEGKINNSKGCDVQSTFLPAAGCVNKDMKKENRAEDKTLINSTQQKLDLVKRAENQSSRELEKTLFERGKGWQVFLGNGGSLHRSKV